jgi:hypothetical protein
MLRKDEESSWE